MVSLPRLPAATREMQDPGQAGATRVVDPSPSHLWPGVGGASADPSLHGSAFSCFHFSGSCWDFPLKDRCLAAWTSQERAPWYSGSAR